MWKFSIGLLPGKHTLPSFLQENKDASIKIQAYARENWYEPSVKLMEPLYNTIILHLVKQSKDVEVQGKLYEDNKKTMLAYYSLH
jgi:hypothetical protein